MVKLHASPVLSPSISILLHWNHPFFIVKSRIFMILDDVYLQLLIPSSITNLDGHIPPQLPQLQKHLVPALATFLAGGMRLIFVVASSVASRPCRKNTKCRWGEAHGFTQHIQHRKKNTPTNSSKYAGWQLKWWCDLEEQRQLVGVWITTICHMETVQMCWCGFMEKTPDYHLRGNVNLFSWFVCICIYLYMYM